MLLTKKTALLLILALLIVGGGSVVLLRQPAHAPSQDSVPTSPGEQPMGIEESFDKDKYPLAEPGSPWWIVNKKRPLPDGYVPPDLAAPDVRLRLSKNHEQMKFSSQAIPAVEKMFADAARDNVTLVFGSGYRSEALQRQFYNSYVARDGQAAADRYSARPGTSEHQTGLAFDVTNVGERCHLEVCFEDTVEGKWVLSNAWKYGFIVRYPEGKESITGYQYEPWHLRYVGLELAAELKRTGQTMEEFFGVVETGLYGGPLLASAHGAHSCCCC